MTTSTAKETNLAQFADVETSSAGYAARFSGPVGEWLLAAQASALTELLKDFAGASVLDVAGGHGQIARALAGKGHRVTVLGSDPTCGVQIQDIVRGGQCSFDVGNVEKLPYPDRSFDAVTCFRYLSHTDNWRGVIGELARVARKAVIVDYPPLGSFNIFYPLLFRVKYWIEGNTRPFAIFRSSEIREAFKQHGFEEERALAQFFLPMGLHRAIKSPAVSGAVEGGFRAAGLTRLMGSPVVAAFVPRSV